MALIADFIKETTSTTGTGTITLVAETGFAEFSDYFSNGDSVYYTINNGDNKETGIGTIGVGKTLTRTTPHVTLVSGTVDDSSPTAINLVGDSVVFLSSTTHLLNSKVEELNQLLLSSIIGTPTYISNFEGVFNHLWSSGRVDGGGITDNLDGSIDVAAGECFIRATASGHATLYQSTFAGTTGLVLTNNNTNYVYVDYNSGAPSVGNTTDPTTIDVQTRIPLAIIIREGTNLTILTVGNDSIDANASLRKRLFYTDTFQRSNGGSIISSPAGRYLACTTGKFWFGLQELVLPAIDTSVTGTFEYYYTPDSGASWVEADATVVSNTQYNNIASGLVSISNNKFANQFVYSVMSTEGSTHFTVVYGQAEYNSLAEAEEGALPTTLPPSIAGLGILLGAITVQQGITNAVSVRSAFEYGFTTSQVTSHNELTDIGTKTHAQIELDIDELSTAKKVVSDTPPANPVHGQEWTDSTTMLTFTWYEDVDTGQWVQEQPQQGLQVNPKGGWKDLTGVFTNANAGGTTPPSWQAVGNGHYAMNFTAGESLFLPFHVPHDYQIGTNAYLHVHWFSDAVQQAGDTTTWTFYYTIAKGHQQAESLTGTRSSFTVTHTADGTEIAGEHMVTEASDLQAFSLIEPDAIVYVEVEMTSTNTAGDIYGIMADIHYQSDGKDTNEKAPAFTKKEWN